VVHREREKPIALVGLQEQGTHERAPLEVEGCSCRDRRKSGGTGLALLFRHAAQVTHIAADVQRRCDDLLWYAVNEIEGGAQDVVAPNYLVDSALEQRGIEIAAQAQRTRNVVDRGVRFQLVEEPDPFLGEG
jgi:hypothetical protein